MSDLTALGFAAAALGLALLAIHTHRGKALHWQAVPCQDNVLGQLPLEAQANANERAGNHSLTGATFFKRGSLLDSAQPTSELNLGC